MLLSTLDWIIVVAYFIASLAAGIFLSRNSGKNTKEYFAAGNKMPWWLLGISLVATTFSTDTPNLVTDIVRTHGVAGNWLWWAFCLTGMLTVFVYARLWRRSQVLTDIEFYELRYSGKPAAFLRGFRAVYLGFFFNIMIMASVSLAAIKIGGILLGISPLQTILIAGLVTVIYSSFGGLKSVLVTDLIQFVIAMIGSVGAAMIVLDLPQVGGLQGLFTHPNIAGKLDLLPDFSNWEVAMSIFLVPVLVQWWSVWYPGAEPGGGGYVAQRMIAARNETEAVKSVLLFNVMHYVLRPWPWIIVGLASMIVYPTVEDISSKFPMATAGNDLGYPAMLTFLPVGLLGLVVSSLIAAYMSTISTHLNWGASYLVNDVYKRFVKPDATDKEQVFTGRISTFVLMLIAGAVALLLESALDSFKILLQIGAGTGLLFILRWFWWRINAAGEIAAMIISFLNAIYFQFIHSRVFHFEKISATNELLISIAITTAGWLLIVWLTKPTEHRVLWNFYQRVYPGGPGWKKVIEHQKKLGDTSVAVHEKWTVPNGLVCMMLGCALVYSSLLSVGYFLYGNIMPTVLLAGVAILSAIFLFRFWKTKNV